jgi:hypothetical protein
MELEQPGGVGGIFLKVYCFLILAEIPISFKVEASFVSR